MTEHFLLVRQAGGPPPMPARSPEYLAEGLGPRLLAVTGALFGLAMITMLARFYIRIFMLKTFGWDDFMMAISAALSTLCMGLFVKLVDIGLGRHAKAFPLENIFPFFKFMYFYSLSIGFFLLRLADRTKWRLFLISILAFIGVFTVGSTFAIIFQCTPVAAGWDYTLRPPTGDGKFYDATIFKNVGVFNSSVNIATDLLFALIPIPMVWKLQVNVRNRVGLAIVLSLGLFASAVAIYKTPMLANFFKEADWSGNGSWCYVWQQVETNVGILAANLPPLKPLFSNFFSQLHTFTKGRSSISRSNPKPFISSGYCKHANHPATRGQNSYAMRDIDTAESRKKDSYGEILVLEKESYGIKVGRSRRQNTAGKSEESVLALEERTTVGLLSAGGGRGSGLGRHLTITKTTEVRISKSYEH